MSEELEGKIKKNKIKLETITPVLSHNAQKKAEFRITELKAAMRFWFRALSRFDTVKEMKKAESKLFGDSDTMASPIRISCLTEIDAFYFRKFEIECSDEKTLKKGKNRDSRIWGIKPNKKIELEFRYQPWAEEYKKNKDYYLNLLKLVSILGSIGQRSRKGYGNFKIIEIDEKPYSFENNNLLEEIKTLLHSCNFKNFKVKENKIIRTNEPPLNYPYVKEIYIKDEIKMEKEKNEQGNDYFFGKIKSIVTKNKPKCNGYWDKYKSKRYACPIYVSCIKSGDNRVRPVITVLKNTKNNMEENPKYKRYKNVFLNGFD